MEFCLTKTKWGWFGFVARDEQLIATFLPGSAAEIRRTIQSRFPEAVEKPNALPDFRREIVEYFAGHATVFSTEVDLSTKSPFHRRVLRACASIPYSKTLSYADLARAVGNPRAARAVGGVMAHNSCPIVIPCHRVLASGGGLGGFSSRGGLAEKERLLKLERAAVDRAKL